MPIHHSAAGPRAGIACVFASFGTAVGALSGSMPVVTRAAAIDSFALGLAITLSTLATVAVMSVGGIVARHTSNRTILLLSQPAFALLTLAFLSSHSPAMFFVTYILLGLAFGFTDLFMNAEGASIEHDLGKPIFTGFHAIVSAAMAVFALLSSYLSNQVGTWATGLAVILSFTLSWFMVHRFVAPRPLAFGRSARIASLPNKSPLILLGLAAGLMIAAELAAILWSAKLLDEQAPALAAIAGSGAAFYGVCTAAVRAAGDRLRARFGDLPLMMASLVVAIAGFMVLGQSKSFTLSIAAFALVGLGTAVLIPCIFALASAFVPANRAAGIGFISMIAGVPRALGPWIFGWTAAAFGISAAFGFFAGVLSVALILVTALRLRRRLA